MATHARKSGIDVLGDMPWGTHFCVFYETKQDLLDTLVPYFKAGLEAHEFCAWAISEPLTEDEVTDAFRRAVPAFERYLADGSMDILPGHEWYLSGDQFDMQRISRGWDEKLRRALSNGYEGMRASGNAFWLDSKHWKDFCSYEQEIDRSIVDLPMTLLCTYPLPASRAADILDVARAHQFTVAKRKGLWEIIETPELKQAKEEIRKLNAELEQRVAERTRELAAVNEELRAEIAERERVEDELRRSEAQLAEAQRLAHASSWTWNLATGRMRWSREQFHIFGFDPAAAEPSYDDAMQRVHPEDRPGLDRAVARAVAAREDFDESFRILLPDGSIRHCQTLGHPVAKESGEVEYVGTVMDITERRRAEEALRTAQAELARAARISTMGELVASIAHEINQPLAAVITNSDASLRWLAINPPNLEEARQALGRSIRDANRASNVIKRIRALLTKDKTEFVEFDLNDAVREIIALMRSTLQAHQVTIRTELAGGLVPVRGDRVQLQQVIMNLIVNGMEAMNAVTGRRRTLAVRSQIGKGGNVLVAVEDSGPGLDPAAAEHIFDPFFTTKRNGMGMGLAISRSIVEAHGGRLWASPGSSQGSVFRFTVPPAAEGPAPGPADHPGSVGSDAAARP